MIRNILNTLSVLSIGSAVFSIGLLFFWYTYPYKTVVFNDPVFPVINKTVKRGSSVTYKSDYCKYMDKPALITRTFSNELLFTTPTIITNRPMGCNVIYVRVEVPQELPAGRFHLVNTYLFDVNPIQKITVIENTEEFNVVE